MTKIITYNLNGIRSAMSKGLMDWIKAADPDILCVQELKAEPGQLDLTVFENAGYHHYWHPAQKKGYSGVAIFTKRKPDYVEYGCGIPQYDFEGRVLRADYGDTSVLSVYHPSGSSGEDRQAFKIKWLADFQKYVDSGNIVPWLYDMYPKGFNQDIEGSLSSYFIGKINKAQFIQAIDKGWYDTAALQYGKQ